MIRDHTVYLIKFKFRREIRQSDGGGGSDFVGYESALSDHEWRVLARNIETAEVWAKNCLKHGYQDAELVSVESLFILDAFIEEHTW